MVYLWTHAENIRERYKNMVSYEPYMVSKARWHYGKKKGGDLTDSGCSLASTGPGFELFPSSGYEGPA